ncbi:MAG: ABC transporter permease subunit [Oscillospiraceae bacterium]|nr:ABC transporter permease subunit [Oscillospiraceae bacterium]
MNDTANSAIASQNGFLNFPKRFWVTLTGLVGIFIVSMLNWAHDDLIFQFTEWRELFPGIEYLRDVPVRFGLADLLGSYQNTNLYFYFGDLSQYNIFKIMSIVIAVLLVLSFATVLFALVRYRSKHFTKLCILGFSLFAFTALLYIVFTMLISTTDTPLDTYKIIMAVLIVLLVASFLLMIPVFIQKRKDPVKSQTVYKFALSAFLSLSFITITMLIIEAMLETIITAIPVIIFVASLSTIPFLLDPAEVKSKRLSRFLHQKAFFYMIIPIMAYVFLFSYYPLKGWEMAFQDDPLLKETSYIGFKWFVFLFTEGEFWKIMRNTLGMSVINLVLGFTTSIFFALLLNEVRQKYFKRVVQTISYLPHFLSWVIAAGMITQFLMSDGLLNQMLGSDKVWLTDADNFWWIVGWGNVWKSVGWNTIIYLAAITSIDPELYESAELDGAGRFAKMIHITLPGIKSTILVLLIMSIGWILSAGYEVQLLLGNTLTWDRAETIDTFVYRYGIQDMRFPLATALGMFKTVVSIILITGANFASKRFAKESLV